MAKWLSHSFDRMILRNEGGGGGPVALELFGYLKRQLELLAFSRTFSLVKDIRNLRISLRNKRLYSYVFITYMRGFAHSSIPRSLH